MKRYLLALLILSNTFTCVAEKHEPVHFSSFFINFIDGTSYIDIGSIFNFAQRILLIVQGGNVETIKKLQKEYNLTFPHALEEYADMKGKVGMIWFKDTYHTLKELRDYEKNNPHDAEFTKALHHAGSHFEKFSEDYVTEIESAKGIMVQIIEQWSKLRHKPNTMLLDWSKVDSVERDALYETMTTFEIFDSFLVDLLLFLKDLVQNCPKSYQKYKEQAKQQPNGSERAY
jgi:hypothetical protein